MPKEPREPLSRTHRKYTFFALLTLFIVLIPFLYLYATGYRIQLSGVTNLVSTGGMYIAAEREGTEIYIDDEIVPEPRVFRQAFYAQSLEPKTHRVTVQREGFHTWVKELPVYAHIVTEAQAFNLPLVPQARVISEWQTILGYAVASTTPIVASTTNQVVVSTSTATSSLERNGEYRTLLGLFSTTTEAESDTLGLNLQLIPIENTATTSTSTEVTATTTNETRNVKLYEDDGRIYARWIGSPEQMPYYYCAAPFERYSTSTIASEEEEEERPRLSLEQIEQEAEVIEFMHPVQIVPEDSECDPVIEIGTQYERVTYFDFYLGNTDLVMLVLESGVYVVEVDNRSWQNMQPILLGTGLDARIDNGNIYVFDGDLIFQMIVEE